MAAINAGIPLSRILRLLSLTPALLLSPSVHALTIVGQGETKDIDQATAQDNYRVQDGGVLNASGASTFEVVVQNNSTLTATGGTFTGRNGISGIELTNSRGTVSGVQVSSDRIGMAINRLAGTTSGSTAVVTDSQISGGTVGVQITGGSTLELRNTQVTGTGLSSTGLRYFGGDVRATNGSRIIGGQTGVQMLEDGEGVGGGAKLVLDNSSVQGLAGAAIFVDFEVLANIEVLNNSTLIAGNGNLLEVQGASTAAMKVANSTLDGNVQVTGNSTANLSFDQSRMTGDVLVEDGSSANVTLQNQSVFTGRLDKVDGVTINSQSSWNMTGNDSIGSLAMNGGTVTFGAQDTPGTFYQLNVGTLAGAGAQAGTFAMKADFTTGERDFLNVTGVATGNFGLLVSASGTDAASPQQLHMVHTGAGDAQFSLVGGPVDVGTWSYDLINRPGESGANDWYLDPTTKTISPGARSVLALFNTAPTVWYGELSSLRSRMGELRFNGGQSGAWIRTYGNKYNVADGSGTGYQQTQQGFSLGVDTPLGDDGWLIGVLAGHSQSDLDLNRGTSGTVKSYYVGPYITWLDSDTGYYFDGVLKFNSFHNESKVGMSDGTRSKGNYHNTGVGGSAEFGRHITFDNGSFIEPFTQLSAVMISARNYDLDNGMHAEGDRTRSLLGKVGMTVGHNFELSGGRVLQPYVRAAMVHEFAKNNEVQVNNNVFNNDLSGSRGELGLGLAVSLSKNLQVHADFDYGKGEHIEQPWGANVGLRLNF